MRQGIQEELSNDDVMVYVTDDDASLFPWCWGYTVSWTAILQGSDRDVLRLKLLS
jgi:hypothetical protein